MSIARKAGRNFVSSCRGCGGGSDRSRSRRRRLRGCRRSAGGSRILTFVEFVVADVII